MRRFLAVFTILVAIVFVGCIGNKNKEIEIEPEIDMEIYDFSYDGHDYIVFTEKGKTINVIHNPDCKCRLHDDK